MSQLSASYPTIKPSLNLDFARTKTLDPRVTFTRASTATFYDGVTVAKAEENQFTNSATMSGVLFGTVDNGDGTYSFSAAGNWVYKSLGVSIAIGVQFTISCDLSGTGTVRLTGLNGDGTAIGSDTVASLTATPTRYSWTGTNAVSGAFGGLLVRGAAAGTAATVRPEKVQLEFRSPATAYTATTTQPITNYIPALRTAAAGVARFDHNPVTGESLGLLIEEQRANLLLRSNDFANAAWATGELSIVSNTVIAPDGTLTGNKIFENTVANVNHAIYQIISSQPAGSYTYTVYVKPAGRNQFRIAQTIATAYSLDFDLNNLTTSNSVDGTTGKITNVGNGWYRCSITFATSSAITLSFVIYTIANGNVTYTGDGYSGLFIWGAQIEAGAFATSYIPTVAASVTRAADNASMTGTNFSSWYRGDEGTLYAEATAKSESFSFTLFQNAGSYIAVDHKTGTPAFQVYVSGTDQSTIGTSILSSKIMGVYKTNDFAVSINGSNAVTDTNGTLPAPIVCYIGSYNGSTLFINGTIRKIAYYPARLTNAQLQTLTT